MSVAAEAEPITAYYHRAMEGHVYIRDTVLGLLSAVGAQIERLGAGVRILELGSHAGFITESLVERYPEVEIVVQDEDERLVEIARQRLAGHNVSYHTRPLDSLKGPVDLVVSVARHHHLPHDYLGSVRRLLAPGAVYLVADELCPEYCTPSHLERIQSAEVIHVAGGYVLTTRAEVAALQADGSIPAQAIELEKLRQKALWRWYRFVVDVAVERGYFDIAASELQSTHDDLITGSDAEHKFGPAVVERQFQLAGFQLASRRLIGPDHDPERQSMFVYEWRAA